MSQMRMGSNVFRHILTYAQGGGAVGVGWGGGGVFRPPFDFLVMVSVTFLGAPQPPLLRPQ